MRTGAYAGRVLGFSYAAARRCHAAAAARYAKEQSKDKT
jgi:hypothetical protein